VGHRQSGSDQAHRRDHGQFRWITESNGGASSASLHTERSLGVIVLVIKNCGQKHAGDRKLCKKIKEVLTRFPYFDYKRRFIPKFKLHYFTTAYEKEIHFAICVF
jgi:hypothetical protein